MEFFKKIGNWIKSHSFIFKLFSYLLSGLAGAAIGAKILHNRNSKERIGEYISDAKESIDGAIRNNSESGNCNRELERLNQAAERNNTESSRIVEQLNESVDAAQSILDQIGKQKLN